MGVGGRHGKRGRQERGDRRDVRESRSVKRMLWAITGSEVWGATCNAQREASTSWGLAGDSQQGNRPQPPDLSEAQHPTAQVQTHGAGPSGRSRAFSKQVKIQSSGYTAPLIPAPCVQPADQSRGPFGCGGKRTGVVPTPFLLSLRRLHRTPKAPWSIVGRGSLHP